jgi:cell division protein FtsL
MNYICLILGVIALILAVQLGRIQTQLYHIEKNLDNIAQHTSKEYLS